MCVCACVRACVRACICVRECIHTCIYGVKSKKKVPIILPQRRRIKSILKCSVASSPCCTKRFVCDVTARLYIFMNLPRTAESALENCLNVLIAT